MASERPGATEMADTWITHRVSVTNVVCLDDDAWLEIDQLALACQVEPGFIEHLVEEGLIAPAHTDPAWRFGSHELTRLRRIRRLQRDFEANLQSVAVMLDLMDEVDRLKAALTRAGLIG